MELQPYLKLTRGPVLQELKDQPFCVKKFAAKTLSTRWEIRKSFPTMVPKWDWKIIPRFTSTPPELQHKIPKNDGVKICVCVERIFPFKSDFLGIYHKFKGVIIAYIIPNAIQYKWEPVWEYV